MVAVREADEMRKKVIRIVLVVVIVAAITVLGIVFLRDRPSEQTYLMISDVPLRIENDQGEELIYDGQDFSGDMTVYEKEKYQHLEPEIFLTVPFSQEYLVIPDAEKMSINWEPRPYIRDVRGTGISQAKISLSDGIIISGGEMNFKISLNAPCLPGPSIARFYGWSQGELEIRPIEEGFEINGAVSFLDLSVNWSEGSVQALNLKLTGTHTVVDLTHIADEDIIVLIEDDGEPRIVEVP